MAIEDRLIIGLGNPGREYQNTRHNLGFMVIDLLAHQMNLSFKNEHFFKAHAAAGKTDSGKLILVKPQTYMNLSGEAVKKIADYYKIPPSKILVVADDAALPLGKLRLRSDGSCGGHRGLQSIQEYLQTTYFPRLKIGIGLPVMMAMEEWVLASFTKKELDEVEEAVKEAAQAVDLWLKEPMNLVMTKVNREQDKSKNSPELGEEKDHVTE
ncbi:MAG: aminoacyl-tRNA hydrolase [Parachlamydiales bacterium]|nr:aminoacyl-tRNA hydrolase [Parachlamydiales bacterium]